MVLAAPLLLACAARHPIERRPIVNTIAVVVDGPSLVIETPECYALTYSKARNGASERLFPVWIELLPGTYSGPAEARHNAAVSDADWTGIYQYHAWRQISTDSLQVRFAGSFEGVSIRLPRKGDTIVGDAIWLTDLVGSPEAGMRVEASRQQCPAVEQSTH
jgi:hypothetical protein